MKITNALTIPNHLGILVYDVDVKESSKRLQEAMHAVMAKYANMQTSDVAKMPAIAATRKAYSTLGKSPSRYRNAAEAMIRRIVKKQGLYQINNVVDLNNLMSIDSGISIGSYILDSIEGDIIYKQADTDAYYAGIGKDQIHIGSLPCLHDRNGPFGNPTSDSQKAMVTEGHHRILTVLYGFGDTILPLDSYVDALHTYCGATRIETKELVACADVTI
ncbi:hypothetical protein EDX97_08400 [Absicoccus porci]|uniref:B3/B4 tRNA-binding domain-containing protein n=1 Tax=Absicoccus porci TaxID=2486576 RepID=A0A3N0HXZ7_9FIRM|nr:phenylalanine--tRNA ligase beta subunit-related protein [Absicoccus porci]RNM29649.1 hypothetical protein EDX97_08400 [Absicoccus porci]